jgi:hypothetical protein
MQATIEEMEAGLHTIRSKLEKLIGGRSYVRVQHNYGFNVRLASGPM